MGTNETRSRNAAAREIIDSLQPDHHEHEEDED